MISRGIKNEAQRVRNFEQMVGLFFFCAGDENDIELYGIDDG